MRLTTWAKLAWRDLLGAPRSSLSLVLVIALSIAANTAIRATSDNFVGTLGNIQRAGIVGDLSVELYENPQPGQLEALSRTGVKWTLITSTMFPARSEQVAEPVLAVLKAVDPRFYPFYGELRLIPAQPLARAIAGTSVLVSPELLHELGLAVGDLLTINGVACHITAVIDHEPDRFAGGFASSLRAIVSEETLEMTGLLRSSNPVRFRFPVVVPDRQNFADIRLRLGQIFQEAKVFDSGTSASPEVDAAKTVSEFLGVMAWLALALGAGGGAVATHLHLESRLETLATLKCLGASNRGAFSWLAIELFLLGGVGGMAGCCAGLLARRPLLLVAGIGASSNTHVGTLLVFEAILIGIALPEILGFAWVLPAIRQRPALLFRRETDYAFSLTASPIKHLLAWLVFCAIAVFLAGKGWSAAAPLVLEVAAALLVLYGVFQIGFRLVQRAVSTKSMASVPLSIRLGARSFLRNGSSNSVITVISAFVAMLVIFTAVGQSIVVREVERSLPFAQANLYLMGFPHSQLAGIRSILDRHPDVHQPYEIRNFAWFRVGTNSSASKLPDSTLSIPLSMVACSTELPADSGIVLDTSVARRYGVHPGSRIMLFESEGDQLEAIVRTVQEVAPADRVWSSIIIPCARVDERDLFHYAGLNIVNREIPRLIRELRASYPALAVVSPSEIFAEVTNVVGTGEAVVRFVALLTIANGLAVVAALMAASARQRAHEIAILRTLGATRFLTFRVLISEFAALGSLAGCLGGIAGILVLDVALSFSLQRRTLEPRLNVLGVAMLLGILLGVAAGSLCGAFVSRQRPLVTLRRD
jgi:putative ABC transport system permease protein